MSILYDMLLQNQKTSYVEAWTHTYKIIKENSTIIEE